MQSPRGAALLVSGLALLAVAFIGWTVETTVLSPTALHDATPELLKQPTAREATDNAVAEGLTQSLPGIAPATADALARAIVDQPVFRAAFADAVVQVRDRVVRGTPPDHAGTPVAIDASPDTPRDVARFTIDAARVDDALHAVALADPQFADLATASVGVVGIPSDAVPDLHEEFRVSQALLRIAGIAGAILVGVGFAITRRRSDALARIGRWAFFTGAATFLVYRAVPYALEVGGGWWGAGGALLHAGDRLTPVALGLMAVGGVTMLVAREWARRERRGVLAAVPINANARHRGQPWHPAA